MICDSFEVLRFFLIDEISRGKGTYHVRCNVRENQTNRVLTACSRPCVVGGATCSGVYTSSVSWRT